MNSEQLLLEFKNKETEIIKRIAFMLDEIVLSNREEVISTPNGEESVIQSPFNSKKQPSIPILDYIKRIIHYTNINLSTLIISMIYLDIICTSKRINLNKKCVHRYDFI
jgi:hypothetical protein